MYTISNNHFYKMMNIFSVILSITLLSCGITAIANSNVPISEGNSKDDGSGRTETFTVNGVSFKMVYVGGGSFTMGATVEQGKDAYKEEMPTHRVKLSSYYIGQTEVTQELWQAVMGSNPSRFSGNLRRPVENVSWDDCQMFVWKLNQLTGKTFRLPTEAEWEFAARGGNKSQGYKYAGSNTIDEVAWYTVNTYDKGKNSPDYGSHPVGEKSPNELGLYDMSGNVWEWCHDQFGDYSSDSQTNPTGASSGHRVMRGGDWHLFSKSCRVSRRSNGSSAVPGICGFRLAASDRFQSSSIDPVLNSDGTEEFTVNGVSFKMVTVKGGTFSMGATNEQGNDAYAAERPAHRVSVSDFAIGQTEVTQALWLAVMGNNPSFFSIRNSRYGDNLQRPVECVTYYSCKEFISKLNELTGKKFRLPTEAEWEFAARGGNKSRGYKYAGSNTIGDVAWYYGNMTSHDIDSKYYGTHSVATKAPNELGLYDMTGNVSEWCQDRFGRYGRGLEIDPTGSTDENAARINRGGSYDQEARDCRVSSRDWTGDASGGTGIGLRLAM